MLFLHKTRIDRPLFLLSLFLLSLLATVLPVPISTAAMASASSSAVRVVVNSSTDAAVQADGVLTLREAMELVNGTLLIDRLSPAEAAQVELLPPTSASTIAFDLPPEQHIIYLKSVLPAIDSPGLTIDGTTQSGYVSSLVTGDVAAPVVAIAPAPQTEVFRGLTLTADRITIRGLSLYGFTAAHRDTASTPPADIFIDRASAQAAPPQDIAIKENWLGVPPDGSLPAPTSAFGVSVFSAIGTVIQHNRIANHDGSGIITAVGAERLLIRDNAIENNGFAGMPDAIRLEGQIDGTQVESNLIHGNAGSGIFLFRPQGSVEIHNNVITANGLRLRRAAIYLLGSGHQITDNQIADQPGAGVVVGAFPRSDRNLIQHNRFAHLDGLSIDLNAQLNTGVENFQRGDGPNPRRNSPNRRRDTGNGAIDAPQFLSPEFLLVSGSVNIDGTADPVAQIELYRVDEPDSLYGPLSEPIATTEADADGRFSFTLSNLRPGDRVSAIATQPQYGTSEPALNAVIQALPVSH